MFDHLHYDGCDYQTKDTPKQMCEYYAIEGGELWTQEYEAEWVADEQSVFKGYMKQHNERWERCTDFTGELNFYNRVGSTWVEYRAFVENGRVLNVERINYEDL